MNEDKIAVIAGTPVDTQMGVDCLNAKNIFNTLSVPMSPGPVEQLAFQVSPYKNKYSWTLSVLKKAQDKGCQRVFVYCNSLSASVDFDELAAETGQKIVTPLHIYRRLAKEYKKLGVIAANAQGLSGIERVMLNENPDLKLISVGIIPLVETIETKAEPDEIVNSYRLKMLADWFEAIGAEGILLGCTHFPYLEKSLQGQTGLKLIDPAENMIEMLRD